MQTLKPLMKALAVGTLFALTACAPAAPPAVDASVDEAALKAATVSWLEAYNAGEVEKIVALYTDDAVLMPPHAPAAKGAAAIRAFLAADTAGAKAAGVKLLPGTATAGVAGNTGWESGTYTITNASGATVDSGSYLSVSHKVNGKWLYYRDTYNSDRPLPTASPAPKKAAPAGKKAHPTAKKKK
jgi:ketosteroid isomerase-like protein